MNCHISMENKIDYTNLALGPFGFWIQVYSLKQEREHITEERSRRGLNSPDFWDVIKP